MEKKKTPTYLQWFFGEHCKGWRGKTKIVAAIYGVFQIVYATPLIMEEYYGGWIPLFPVILVHLTMWGFLLGILYQPYSIYRRLVRTNWFERREDFWFKNKK